MADPNAELVRTLVDAFAAGDRDTLGACFAEDVLWHTPGRSLLAGDREGRADVLEYLDQIAALTGGTYTATPRDVLTSGDRAALLYRANGVRTNRVLDLDQVMLFDIRDGKIVEARLIPEDQYVFDEFWG